MMLRSAAIALFVASFVIVLLTDGGVYPASLSIATFLMALSLAISAATARMQSDTLAIFVGVLGIWLLVAGWTLLQLTSLPGGLLANHAWATLAAQGMEVSATISVAPGDGLYSLLPLSLAFMTFLSALLLFRHDNQAQTALAVFAICGAAVALFAIAQFQLFPGMLMFAAKVDYLSSLTAPFVNRNTAATFYGLVLISLLVCMALETSKTRQAGRSLARPFDTRWLYGCMTLVVAIALALTTSRGGIGAAVIAAGGLSAILLVSLRKRNASAQIPMRRSGTRQRRLIVAAMTAISLAVVAVFLFGRTLFRASMIGGEDGRFCVYPDIMKAISDNRMVGVGAGAFEQVFPAYMDPRCGMTDLWTRAHNGYFDMALAYGMPLTAIIVMLAAAIVVGCVMTGFRRRRSRKSVVWGSIGVSTLVILHSSIDFSMQIPGFAMSFMLAMALLMSLSVSTGRRVQINI